MLFYAFDRTIYRWELLITAKANMPHLSLRSGKFNVATRAPPYKDVGSKRCW